MQTLKSRLSNMPVTRSLAVLALVVIAVEIGGVWSELRGLRREQVKNAAVSMAPDALARIKQDKNASDRLRVLNSESIGMIGPVDVHVDGSILDPIYVQAKDSVPVEIQR
jgi:hypothetical protein